MAITVRPFEESVDRGSEQPKASIKGSLRGGGFVVTALEQDIVLDTVSLGIDDRGGYAILEERSYELNGAAQLVVAFDELMGAGTVAVELVRVPRGAVDDLVLGFWLQFDSDGLLETKGSSHRGPAILAAVPQ